MNLKNDLLGEKDARSCTNELHTGNIPRSIMTKGNSMSYGTPYGNFIRGNKDKLMISYRREPTHNYSMTGSCGVLFEGEMHFFGGINYPSFNLTRQHFVIETRRSGQTVRMTQKKDLEIGFWVPSCSSFKMTSKYFPWFEKDMVLLCFNGYYHNQTSCYSFDGELSDIADSNHEHVFGKLTKYKKSFMTVGGGKLSGGKMIINQKTEIMSREENNKFSWSVVDTDFIFTRAKGISGHSLVTVESSDINEEYVLLIGGSDEQLNIQPNVFKFNGTWTPFGKLNKPRADHNSIYWNGAVYVIGGAHTAYTGDNDDKKTKTEIWNVKDSQDQFKTKENWPELFRWRWPHLFIVPDSFFPDR